MCRTLFNARSASSGTSVDFSCLLTDGTNSSWTKFVYWLNKVRFIRTFFRPLCRTGVEYALNMLGFCGILITMHPRTWVSGHQNLSVLLPILFEQDLNVSPSLLSFHPGTHTLCVYAHKSLNIFSGKNFQIPHFRLHWIIQGIFVILSLCHEILAKMLCNIHIVRQIFFCCRKAPMFSFWKRNTINF